MRTIALIANLTSNRHKNQRQFDQEVIDYLQKNHIDVKFHPTDGLETLKKVIHESIAIGITEYVTVGGDGSIHYLVHELMNQNLIPIHQIHLGIIPKGTGNDWIRNFNFSSMEEILQAIVQGKTKRLDIGKISFLDKSFRYFVNIAGIGFNGEVIQSVDRFKWLGVFSYYFALFWSFFGYKSRDLELEIDGDRYKKNTFLLSIGIGKYAGGNMKLCPQAIIDDGLFEINLIEHIGFWTLIRYIHTLRDGTYLNYIPCISKRAKSIKIVSNNYLYAEADGEFLGKEIQSIDIMEKTIHVYSKEG